jgi:thiosulfate reductase cytochrome b subunit
MAALSEGMPDGGRGRSTTGLTGAAVALGVVAGAIALVAAISPTTLAGMMPESPLPAFDDAIGLALLYGAGALMVIGALGILVHKHIGAALLIVGSLLWLTVITFDKTFNLLTWPSLILGLAGGLFGMAAAFRSETDSHGPLIFRQSIFTRVTHWTWAIALFFLLLSGLQIFNAHPTLYIGQESGFTEETRNAVLEIYAVNRDGATVGQTRIFGQTFDTTGVLGKSGPEARPQFIGFPAWATIPSTRDLATGRVVHFFFAWILVIALAVWLVASLVNGHLWRDVILKPRDLRDLPRDIVDHAVLRFKHGRTYSPLQKVAYGAVFFVLLPLIILTGLTMSPGLNASWPWLLDIFGGRQTARTLHFVAMVGLVLFFVVHIIMVVLANPINELRSMITGYYRASPGTEPDKEKTHG